MCDPRQYHLVKVGQQSVEWFRRLRCRIRYQRGDVTRLDGREDGVLSRVFEIVCDPFNDSMAVLSEFIGRHVFWHFHMVAQ